MLSRFTGWIHLWEIFFPLVSLALIALIVFFSFTFAILLINHYEEMLLSLGLDMQILGKINFLSPCK